MAVDSDFPEKEPPDHVWRVAYGRDPLALRPPETITEDAPANGRFDDSYRTFRTLYTASSKEGAYREALRNFRPSPDLLQAMRSAAEDDPEEEDPTAGVGEVPISWLAARCIGKINVMHPSPCLNITHSRSLDAIRARMRTLRVADILGEDRQLTQTLARLAWNDKGEFHGVAYPSAEGAEVTNFAFFEDGNHSGRLRARLVAIEVSDIDVNDDAFFAVIEAFGLIVPGFAETHEASFLFPGFVPWHEQIALALKERDARVGVASLASTPMEAYVVSVPERSSILIAQLDKVVRVYELRIHIDATGKITGAPEVIADVPIATDMMAERVADLILGQREPLEVAVRHSVVASEER
jgi:RES domain